MNNTSISETLPYKDFCRAVIEDPTGEMIKTFRRQPDYDLVIPGSRGKGIGDRHLAALKEKYPYLLEKIDIFKDGQDFGGAIQHDTEFGLFDENYFRHIFTLGTLIEKYGPMDDFHIVEIGPGGGMLFKIITDYYPKLKYSFLDLCYPLQITRRFVEHLKRSNNVVSYLTSDFVLNEDVHLNRLYAQKEYDLFISECALSECYEVVQKLYVDKICNHSKRGRIAAIDCMDFKGEPHLQSKELFEYIQRPDKKFYSDPNYGGIISWGEL